MQNRNYSFTRINLVIAAIAIFGFYNKSIAQCTTTCGPNMINNSSFEATTASCSIANSEIFTDYSQVQNWFGTACETCPGNGSTPDYYNSGCSGAAPTENCGFGTGSVGFFTSADVGGSTGSNAREYVQTQLSSPLVAGQEYCATIQVKTSPASFAYVPTDGLGLWFTDGMVDIDVDNGGQQFLGSGSMVNATPQIQNTPGNLIDTVCTTITGTFVANGTETWMVMGNFLPDNMIQTNASCGGLFTFCFGYLIVDLVDVYAVCSSCDASITTSGPFCVSDPSTNLTAATPGGTWSGPGITDANLGTFDPSVAGVGTHQVIYDLTCGDDDTLTIVVNAIDDPSFSYGQSSYCLNAANPSPTITGLSGGTFSIDGSASINAVSGEIDILTSGSGNYMITYLTNGPCPSSTTFNVTIIAALNPAINAAGPFCEYDPQTTLTAVDGGGTWSGTGITDANLGTFNPSIAGIGTHTITYDLGCGDIDTEDITVNGVDNTTTLTGLTISSNQNGATYQWLDCNKAYSPVAGETSQDFETTTNGSYAVAVTINGCTDTSDCVAIEGVSIGENLGQNDFSVYPNPTEDYITISGLESLHNEIGYCIYDNLGRLVICGNTSEGNRIIDCSILTKGIYTIKLTDSDHSFHTQFIKQ